MARRLDDEWLPASDAEVDDWRESVKAELEGRGLGGDSDEDFDLDDFDTQTLAWMLHHLEDDD